MDRLPVDLATIGPGWTVREAAPGQHAEIRSLLRAAYGPYAAVVRPELFGAYLADVLDLGDEGVSVLVVPDGGAVVGTARLLAPPAGLGLPDGAAYVRGVAAAPGREGEGIAAALMAVCAERAGASGATDVYLHTTSFMTRAVHLYERLGYRRTPDHDTDSREHYGLAVEPRLRALAFRLDLTDPRPPEDRP